MDIKAKLTCVRSLKITRSDVRSRRARSVDPGVAQWWSACPACTRPWVWPPALPEEEKKRERKKGRNVGRKKEGKKEMQVEMFRLTIRIKFLKLHSIEWKSWARFCTKHLTNINLRCTGWGRMANVTPGWRAQSPRICWAAGNAHWPPTGGVRRPLPWRQTNRWLTRSSSCMCTNTYTHTHTLDTDAGTHAHTPLPMYLHMLAHICARICRHLVSILHTYSYRYTPYVCAHAHTNTYATHFCVSISRSIICTCTHTHIKKYPCLGL